MAKNLRGALIRPAPQSVEIERVKGLAGPQDDYVSQYFLFIRQNFYLFLEGDH